MLSDGRDNGRKTGLAKRGRGRRKSHGGTESDADSDYEHKVRGKPHTVGDTGTRPRSPIRRVAAEKAAVAISVYQRQLQQWKSEAFIENLRNAQIRQARRHGGDVGMGWAVGDGGGLSDAVEMGSGFMHVPEQPMLGTCTACMTPGRIRARPCLAEATCAICEDCVVPMLTSMVDDIRTGTRLTTEGTCMIHYGKAECAAYSVDAMIALVRDVVEEESLADDMVAALRAAVAHCAHAMFAIEHACTRVIACRDCGRRVSMAPSPAPQSLSLVLKCRYCFGAEATCVTCGVTDVPTPLTTEWHDIDDTVHVALGHENFLCTSCPEGHPCKPLPSFDTIVRMLKCPGDTRPPPACDGAGEHHVDGRNLRNPVDPVDVQYFVWVMGAVQTQVDAHVDRVDPMSRHRTLRLPPAARLQATYVDCQHPEWRVKAKACGPFLDHIYEAAMKQKCPTCGKDGTKDDKCTHITCCKLWCYGCGHVLAKAVTHVCEFGLYMDRDRGPDKSICASSPEAAVRLFHSAKLVLYARHWLACVGVARGIQVLLQHEHLGPWWREYGCLVFSSDVKKRWLVEMSRTLDACSFFAIFGFMPPVCHV
jgi:hypothetical protein